MTKPLIHLLLLFGGAMTAGAGILTYSEWRSARQPVVAVAPVNSGGSDSAPGGAVPSGPATPQAAPSGAEAPTARSGQQGESAKRAPAAEEGLAIPQQQSPAAHPSIPAAPRGKIAAPVAEEPADQAGANVPAPAAPETFREEAQAVPASPIPGEPSADGFGEPVGDVGDNESQSAASAVASEHSPASESASVSSTGLSGQVADSIAVQPHETADARSEGRAAGSAADGSAGSGPAFDIVRVEPTGEAVIAGSAPANSKVQILSNGEIVAETEANAGGAWVALPYAPLVPGTHDLTIRALRNAGEATNSEQRVAVAVPEQPGEEVVALLDRPGQPSEVLSRPGGDVRAGAQPPQKLDPIATATELGTGGPQPDAAQAPILSVDAVEAEGRTMFVAGAGDPGALVRVYVDGELVGQAQASAGGRWLVQATRTLEEGEVTVRADQVEAGTAQVEARAEVPFVRRLDMASLVPAARGGAGAAQSAAGESLPSPNAVIIRRGDNLWTISRRTYGRGVRYTTIYKANEQQIRDPHWIYPGQVFMLPTGDRSWAENQR